MPVELCTNFTSGGTELGVMDLVRLMRSQQGKLRTHEYECEIERQECVSSQALAVSITPMGPFGSSRVRVDGQRFYVESKNFGAEKKSVFHSIWSNDGEQLRSLEKRTKAGIIRRSGNEEFIEEALPWRDFFRQLPATNRPSQADDIESAYLEFPQYFKTGTCDHPSRGKVVYLQTTVNMIFFDPSKDYCQFAVLHYPEVVPIRWTVRTCV